MPGLGLPNDNETSVYDYDVAVKLPNKVVYIFCSEFKRYYIKDTV